MESRQACCSFSLRVTETKRRTRGTSCAHGEAPSSWCACSVSSTTFPPCMRSRSLIRRSTTSRRNLRSHTSARRVRKGSVFWRSPQNSDEEERPHEPDARNHHEHRRLSRGRIDGDCRDRGSALRLQAALGDLLLDS